MKGDFIPGCSDLDLHAFVDPEMLISDRTPKLERALPLRDAIGGLEPRDAGVRFQIYFLRVDRAMEDWTPPVPGSYVVVYGTPPPAVLDWESYDYVGDAKAGPRADSGRPSESDRPRARQAGLLVPQDRPPRPHGDGAGSGISIYP